MSAFERISDQAAWQRCLEQFDYFHDSILREIYLISKGHVAQDCSMFDDQTWDARLIFQSQSKHTPGLELVLEGVAEFRVACVEPEPSLTFGRDGIELALAGAYWRKRSLIIAKSAQYRLLQTSVLGNQLRIGSPIVSAHPYVQDSDVEHDEAEAMRWLRQSAAQGDVEAQTNLGLLYALGRGVERDDAEAVRWYQQAAVRGDAYAQAALGEMYQKGRGMGKDKIQAYRWLHLAAAGAVEGAVRNLEQLRRRMTTAQVAQAMELASTNSPEK